MGRWDDGRAGAQCKAGRGDTSRSYWGAPDAAASDQRGIAGGLAIPQSGYGAFGLRRSAWKIDQALIKPCHRGGHGSIKPGAMIKNTAHHKRFAKQGQKILKQILIRRDAIHLERIKASMMQQRQDIR